MEKLKINKMFNFGKSEGGHSGSSAYSESGVYGGPTVFGSGRVIQGNVYTGKIGNNQQSSATGGSTSQSTGIGFTFNLPELPNPKDMMPSLGLLNQD